MRSTEIITEIKYISLRIIKLCNTHVILKKRKKTIKQNKSGSKKVDELNKAKIVTYQRCRLLNCEPKIQSYGPNVS